MPRPRVLCMEDLSLAPDALKPVEALADVDYSTADRATLLERIPAYEVYFGGAVVRFDREVIDRAARLRVVATPSTGTDHIDGAALRERGIELLSLTRETKMLDSFTATAEHTWGLLLASLRRIPAALDSVRRGRWARMDGFISRQLSGKTLGVIGVGRLGRMVVEYGRAFRMRVLGCDPVPFEIAGVERVDLAQLVRESDVISLHVHLNDQTRGMLSPELFNSMQPGAIILNTSRGGLIDEAALLEGLESGKIAAAGLDFIDGEWMADITGHPLVRYAQTHDNLVITPHIASSCIESIAGGRIHMGKMLADYLRRRIADFESRITD